MVNGRHLKNSRRFSSVPDSDVKKHDYRRLCGLVVEWFADKNNLIRRYFGVLSA